MNTHCRPAPRQVTGSSVRRTTLIALVIAAVGGAVLTLGACATGDRQRAAADAPPREDGLISLAVHWSDGAEGRAALYEIRRDGTIAFGGGFDASSGKTTWSGPLDPADRAAIWATLRADGWVDAGGRGRIQGTGEPRSRRGDVRITTAAGMTRHSIRGASPELDRLRERMEQATAGRFDQTLRALPQAGDAPR